MRPQPRYLEAVRRAGSRCRRRRAGVVILNHVDNSDTGKAILDVGCVRGFVDTRQRDVGDGDVALGQITHHVRHCDIAIVWSFGASRDVDCFVWLPRGVPVIQALVHVDAADADGGAPEVEVNAPEGGAEGVGEAGGAFVVEAVGLAEDEGDGVIGQKARFVDLVCD